MTARIHQISVSRGGVPKLAVPDARITCAGLEGDWQHDRKHHGGPDRAVCLFSLEVIERLRAEGHPIAPGSTGENLTITGLDWPAVVPGVHMRVEGGDGSSVVLEVVSYTRPCSSIRGSFAELKFGRIFQDEHPGESRVYARVLCEGTVKCGASVHLLRSFTQA